MSKNKKKRRAAKRISPWVFVLVFALSGIVAHTLHRNPELWRGITNWVGEIFSSTAAQMPDGEAFVHFIDVGQGDAVLIQTAGGNMLIDGGDNGLGEQVLAYLRANGVFHLDYVVATHPHADHIGGLIDVLAQVPVGTLIMPPVAHTTRTFERFLDAIENNNILVREPVAGSVFAMGEGIFTIIAPNSSGYANLNNYSVSLRFDFGATSFIFTGDAERISENEMVAAGHNLNADVLRIGHHGSNTSTTQGFLDAVSPRIAVINVGVGNIHGHPHNAVIERLNATNIRIYRTDFHGNIVIVSDGASLVVNHD